ncbi:hypothetical protein BG004_008439 [Podila humilis]|nr:hypothetical protein BG004_008439 [Podila humilis]
MSRPMIRKFTVLVATIALTLLVLLQTASKTVDAAPIPQGGGDGVVNPLTTGLGRGVAGAARGTKATADLLGEAVAQLFHNIGGLAANAEQGAGQPVVYAGSAVEGTVDAFKTYGVRDGNVLKVFGA